MLKRAQTSIEMGILLSMLLIAAVVLINLSLGQDSRLNFYRTKLSAGEIADTLAARINAVSLAGNGALANYTLPSRVADTTVYGVRVYANARVVEVFWNNSRAQASIVTSNVNATNASQGAVVQIRNVKGMVQVT